MLEIDAGICAVKFGASWCAPCKLIEPSFKKMKSEFQNIRFLSVDVDSDPSDAKQYRIRSLPTVILFRDGQEINRLVGAAMIDSLRKSIRDIIAVKAA